MATIVSAEEDQLAVMLDGRMAHPSVRSAAVGGWCGNLLPPHLGVGGGCLFRPYSTQVERPGVIYPGRTPSSRVVEEVPVRDHHGIANHCRSVAVPVLGW
jgi:hypothetical protein